MSGKTANKRDVKPLVISGTSPKPHLKDDPINMNSTHEYVMQYTDIFGTENGSDVVDIQEGDAISDCSDSEVVAHSNEVSNYESHSHSENESEGEYREGPPPLPDSDDESDFLDHQPNDLPGFSGVDGEEDGGEWDYEGTQSVLPIDNYGGSPPPLPTADDSDNSVEHSESPVPVSTADSDYGSNAMDELETCEQPASATGPEQNSGINLASTADMCIEHIQEESSTSSDDDSQEGDKNEEQNASEEKFQEALENYAPEISNNNVCQSSDEFEEQKLVSDTVVSAQEGQTKQRDSDDEIHYDKTSDGESVSYLVEEIQETSSLIETRINNDSDGNSDVNIDGYVDENNDQQQQVQETEINYESGSKVNEQETKQIAVQGLQHNDNSESEKQTGVAIFLTKPQTSVLGIKDDDESKTKVEVKNKSASSKKLAHSDTKNLKKGRMQSKYPGTAVKSSPRDVSTTSSSTSQSIKKEFSKSFSQKAENLAKPKTEKRNSEVGVKDPTVNDAQKTRVVKTAQKNSPHAVDSNWRSEHKAKPQSTLTPVDSGSSEKGKRIKEKSDRSGTEKGLEEIKKETDEQPLTKHESGRKRERRSMSSRLAAAVESEQKKGSNITVTPLSDCKVTAGREQKVNLSGSTSSESATVGVETELKDSHSAAPDTGKILKAAATSVYSDSEAKEKSSRHVSDEKEKGHFKTKKFSPIVPRPLSAGNTLSETSQRSNKQTKLNKHSKMFSPDTGTLSMQRHDSEPKLRQKLKNNVLNSNTNEGGKVRPSSVSIAVGTEDDNDDDECDKEILSATQRSNQTLDSNSKTKSFENKKKAEPYSSHPQNGKFVQLNPSLDKQKKSEHNHHKKTTHHPKHDRKKHVWLCRDDEIHKLIAQKASMLKEYESGSLAGTNSFSGKTSTDILNDISGVPDVGFVTKKPKNSRTTRPVSELIPENRLQKKENRLSLQHHYQGTSSEDEDERTNRVASNKNKSPGSTFSVGIASRKFTKESELSDESDNEETCEYCLAEKAEREAKKRNPAWEGPHHPRNLLLGVVYSCKYLGSTQIMSPQSPNRAVRMQQAQEAMGRIKVPEGEDQPTTDVDVFISTERLKVVNATNKEVMIDHGLRNVSFIADIGDILVLMARRDALNNDKDIEARPSQILASIGTGTAGRETIKITCHVFQSEEAQLLAKSIGQAFNVAYQEFLKKNGLSEDAVEDAEYSGVLEAQKILGEDLSLLADESKSKEVIVNKKPAEMLGVMIVESGWGSMIPTAIIAHLAKDGAAAKSGQLNVGDQILAVNGLSFVGLPLTECQAAIKNTRPGTKIVLKIVSCPPTVQVSVNRPDTKYQLGFSVQNGMICSLMRGSIAERGGVRVGHRIIEINGESVVATSHQRIVELLATTIGEIRMKTMPAAMYRLLVGLDTPTHI